MSHSRKKMRVTATRNTSKHWNGKRWVRVDMLNSKTWWPSFEDLHRIIQAICLCEDEKYPHGKGRNLVADFLRDAVSEDDFSRLAEKYRIPNRCGEPGLKKY